VLVSNLDLQALIDKVDAESRRFGLKISIAKTEVQCIATHKQTLTIDIHGERLQQSKDFYTWAEKYTKHQTHPQMSTGVSAWHQDLPGVLIEFGNRDTWVRRPR